MYKTASYHHARGQELMSNLMEKNAVDVHGLRNMWSKIVKPRYARQSRSYSKAAKRASTRASKVQGWEAELKASNKLGFNPTPHGVEGGIPKYKDTKGAFENPAVAMLPNAKASRQIGSGRHLVNDTSLLSDAAKDSRRLTSSKQIKTYGDSEGLVIMSPGSSYANLNRGSELKQRALNRIRQKAGKQDSIVPRRSKRTSNLSAEDQEVYNRVIGGHEAREVQIGTSRNVNHKGKFGNLEDAEFQTHAMPSVILKNDLNIVNTLPARNKAVKDAFLKKRLPEIRDLQEKLPQHRDVLESVLQGKRISRHQIKKIDRDYATYMGFKKRGRQDTVRYRKSLRQAKAEAQGHARQIFGG